MHYVPQGVLQLCRNLFAVQQNLTNIDQNSHSNTEQYFERARTYFGLLKLDHGVSVYVRCDGNGKDSVL